jgi:uncharacterized membrane protein YcaP (DUF421 family)
MKWFERVDWYHVFVPSTPLLEIVVRGTLTYLGLFVLLRVILKRQSGNVSVSDILVLVLISDAAQNAMANDYHSVPDGLLLVAVIIGWSYLLDLFGYWFPGFQRLVHPPPLLLVKDGRILRQNMRRELVTEDELFSQLREQGLENLDQVKLAFMEGDGAMSIVPKKKAK